MVLSIASQQSADSLSFASLILPFAFTGLLLVAMWRVFTKAGQPGWASLIPFYNLVVLLKIIGRPVWWMLLALIPLVNFVISIILYIDLAKSFGKGAGFAMGLMFLSPIFFPILAFGNAQYVGPAAQQSSVQPALA